MRTIRINKGDLVNTITKNRAKHKDDFDKASKAYRLDMLAALHGFAVKLEAGENVNVLNEIKDYPPVDHTENYDTALLMLEMSVDSVIELTHEEFQNMVLDNWSWKRNWESVNMKYLGK